MVHPCWPERPRGRVSKASGVSARWNHDDVVRGSIAVVSHIDTFLPGEQASDIMVDNGCFKTQNMQVVAVSHHAQSKPSKWYEYPMPKAIRVSEAYTQLAVMILSLRTHLYCRASDKIVIYCCFCANDTRLREFYVWCAWFSAWR